MAKLALLVIFSLLSIFAFACGELIHGPIVPTGVVSSTLKAWEYKKVKYYGQVQVHPLRRQQRCSAAGMMAQK